MHEPIYSDDVSKQLSPAAKLLGIFIIASFGLLAALAIAELAARFVLDDGMNFDLEMWKYAKDLKRPSEVTEVGHEHIPNTSGFYMGVPVEINSTGQRDHEYALLEPPGTLRILMLGDSLTFGWGVRIEETPAKRIESILNASVTKGRFEVINMGVGNYNTAMEVAHFLSKATAWRPDIVVLNYFINDAESTPKRKTNPLTEYSYAAVMFAGALDNVSRMYFGKADWKEYYSDLYEPDAAGWSAAQTAIKKLADYCRNSGIALMIVNYPELHELDPYPFSSITKAIRNVAQANGAPFLDLLPSLRGQDPKALWVSPGDAHPNGAADARIADAILAALKGNFPSLMDGENQ
jgi:lysophospholipase L1-like esterase